MRCPGHLADGSQPFVALLSGRVLRLVGVLDLGEVQIDESVEGPDGRHHAIPIAGPCGFRGRPLARCGVGTGRCWCRPVEADLNVPPPDPPPPDNVVPVIWSRQQLAEPANEGSLEPVDFAAGRR